MVLDEDATQKYVLIEAYPDGGSEDPTYLVRGSRHAKYHKDAAKETLEALEVAAVPHRVLGSALPPPADRSGLVRLAHCVVRLRRAE